MEHSEWDNNQKIWKKTIPWKQQLDRKMERQIVGVRVQRCEMTPSSCEWDVLEKQLELYSSECTDPEEWLYVNAGQVAIHRAKFKSWLALLAPLHPTPFDWKVQWARQKIVNRDFSQSAKATVWAFCQNRIACRGDSFIQCIVWVYESVGFLLLSPQTELKNLCVYGQI